MSHKKVISVRLSRETEYLCEYLQAKSNQSRTDVICDAIESYFYNSFIDDRSASDALARFIESGKV